METNSKSRTVFVMPCVKCATLNRVEVEFNAQAVELEKKEDASPQESAAGGKKAVGPCLSSTPVKVEAPKEEKANGKPKTKRAKGKHIRPDSGKGETTDTESGDKSEDSEPGKGASGPPEGGTE